MISEKNAKQFCKDDISLIENYEEAVNDKTKKWHIHHRLERTINGEFAHTLKELKRFGMYYHRPYFELIFLSPSDHNTVHHKGKIPSNKGKPMSQKSKDKLSKSMKGTTPWNKGIQTSEFGIKFKEHYGNSNCKNHKLYDTEFHWYKRHGKCSWE